MKILVITDLCRGFAVTLPERFLYKGLYGKGVDISVITHFRTAESEELEKAGIKMYYIPLFRKFDIKAIRKIRELLIREKYDILYLTFGKAITNSLFASRGIKVSKVGYLGSLNVHWHDPTAYLSFLNPSIDRMVCLSDAVLEHIVKQAGEKFRHKCVRIYKGYDPEWINPGIPLSREELNIPENALIAGCVANVRPEKGIPYLIQSAGCLREDANIYFLLAGKGMDKGKQARLIRQSRFSDRFRVFGFVDDIFRYTAACDVYVQPSVSEGLGRSVIEAMCLKKPVIVTSRGGAKELVEEGVNGYVVPSRDPEAIARSLMRCWYEKTRLAEMGEKSLQKVKKMLDPAEYLEQIHRLFCELTEKKTGSGSRSFQQNS